MGSSGDQYDSVGGGKGRSLNESRPEKAEPLLPGLIRDCLVDAVVGGLGKAMFSPLSKVNVDDTDGFRDSTSLDDVSIDAVFLLKFNGEGTTGLTARVVSLLNAG